ncbi:MAG: hypothetical protein AAF219_07130 [Myxococcota bacterium]
MGWTADITNDPDNDFRLYIEIMHGEEFWGRIAGGEDGELVLQVYEQRPDPVPLDWLLKLGDRAQVELKAALQNEPP